MRKPWRLLIALVLAVAGLGVAPPGAVASGPPTDVIAVGHVVRASSSGLVPVAGATVYLWTIPGVSTAEAGDELSVVPLAQAQTDTEGRYALSVPPGQLVSAAARNGGWVNLDIGALVPQSGAAETSSISRQIVSGGWAKSSLRSAARLMDSRLWNTPAAAEAPYVPESLEATTDFVITASSPRVRSEVAQPLSSQKQAYCSFITDATPQRTVSVVEFHNATNANAWWSYGVSADSDIQKGIDHAGNGGWGVSGSVHMSTHDGGEVGRVYNGGVAVNNFGRMDFKFIDGHYQPYGEGLYCQGTTIFPYTKTKVATQWVAGVSTSALPGSEFIGCSNSPQSSNRTSYPVGSYFHRKTNNAAQIGLAVDIGPISVGAKSGYSTNVESRWDSKRGNGIWLCGTNSGVTTAGVIHAQNR
jgi:hypothetical protein